MIDCIPLSRYAAWAELSRRLCAPQRIITPTGTEEEIPPDPICLEAAHAISVLLAISPYSGEQKPIE